VFQEIPQKAWNFDAADKKAGHSVLVGDSRKHIPRRNRQSGGADKPRITGVFRRVRRLSKKMKICFDNQAL
jgi:hypothetical protein